MRIQTLEVENFMPYRDPVTLDFHDLSLFAIVGETGSGKSSIVDAICYALYGRIPRIRTENGQRENVISRGAKQFHVALTFDLGGATYRIIRQGTATREDVQVFKDGDQLNQLLKKKDADRYIEETLLHMNFDVFTRIIVLPQGQFDRFLKPDTPRARRDILISLLNLDIYEHIGKAAGTHAGTLMGELGGLDHDLAGIDQNAITDEAMGLLDHAVTDAGYQVALLQEQLKADELALAMMEQRASKARQLAKLQGQLGALRDKADAVASDRSRLATSLALASLQPSLANWARLAAELEKLIADRDKASAAVTTTQKALETAQAVRADTSLRAGEAAFAEKLDEISSAIARLSDLQPFAARLEELQHKTDSATNKAQGLEHSITQLNETMKVQDESRIQLQEALARARDASTQAEDAFERARSDNAAVVVQQGLRPGDTCPVCGHVVEELVAHAEHLDFARFKTVRDEARKSSEHCQDNLTVHEKKSEADRVRLEELARQLTVLKTEDKDDQHEAHELTLRLLMDPTVAREGSSNPVAFLRMRLTQLRGQETTTRTAQKTIVAQLEEQRRKEEAVRTQLAGFQTEAAALEGQRRQAEIQHETLQRDLLTQAGTHGFDSIASMKTAVLPADQLVALQVSVRQYDHDTAAATAQVEMLEQELGPDLPSEADLEAARAARETAATDFARAQEDLTAARRSKDDLLARRAFLADRLARKEQVTRLLSTYQQVARDFGSKGMVAFVSSGILEQLLVTANDHLRILSKGRFELLLDEGDQMMVQDSFSSSGPRDVATLSGGETFLASLALALAVKDLLSTSVDLDSFFIDEGFGTLDETTVQGVADVLESLRRDGSLVGIITHRADLVERFETVLQVTNQSGSAHIARREMA
ncbi:AAA family ATPase [Candidatus Cryosericum septentrionale]|jgi:exonuclease SbcC|uniref:SMC family ATPase n=1 Tax=Candidatus Cryosericum septentrionale TaxID=2290913 RepID=A0A398E4D1_9BACT|nr:SMC family ATPase [Candidatus Cryosericum septentrionale]RIE17481.1 SMC family ATPase [Candidatus Cryosericum septentrionale]